MPKSQSRRQTLSLAAIGVVLFAAPVLADEKLAPADIQTIFATGKPFLATAPTGKAMMITLKADGSATAVPKGKKKGNKGKWHVSDTGYCSAWGKGAEHCFTIRKAGTHYEVVNDHNIIVATWNAP